MEQRHHTNFDDFSLTRALGEALRSQHKLTEALPQRLRELLSRLDQLQPAEVPPTQPKQSEDGNGAHSVGVSGAAAALGHRS
jgi:hypothetical protein